jgi:hypothetical protein
MKMEFKEFYSLFENKTIHRLLAKKSYTQFMGLSGLCWYLLHGLTNSRSINGLQFFSDLCHQALCIFWTIIVAVDLPFQVYPKIFDPSYLFGGTFGGFYSFGTYSTFSSSNRTYPLRSLQMPNQARIRFFCFCGIFGYILVDI